VVPVQLLLLVAMLLLLLLLLLLLCLVEVLLLSIVDFVNPVKLQLVLQGPYPCLDSVDDGQLDHGLYKEQG
jgi:hypothetical protein